MIRPNFFLIGAPKCGTTAWSTYLGTHPNLLFSDPKETHYFSDDFPNRTFTGKPDAYAWAFRKARPHHRVIGEGSVWYLYSATAIPRIREYNPDARIMICLRNPADMVYSLHNHFVADNVETETSFERAWTLQEKRASGWTPPMPQNNVAAQFQYRDKGCFSRYVENVYRHFPREQVHVVFFEEFVADPRRAYLDTLRFLGIPDDGRTEFPRVNEARVIYLPRLNRILAARPPWAVRVNSVFKRLLGRPFLPWAKLRHLTTRPASRSAGHAPMPPALRQSLGDEFAADIAQLETVLGRSLDIWRNTPFTTTGIAVSASQLSTSFAIGEEREPG